ncbi:hypothetical protein [Aeromonas allosaccharophila]|uniref:hypothetical protein n=1 Tax=Aeromonas allosaccharophila TaxID=656 RepID=UPI003D24FE0F
MLCQSAPTLLAILFMLLAALSNLRSHRLNLRLNYLSCHDALTRAFNRHYLERLEQGASWQSKADSPWPTTTGPT